jgi:prepilin-type N-terminal cleavage/methylation domain-containing protein
MVSRERLGYSLIEMLVATAILLVAVGVLTELADVGRQHAGRAEEAAAAQRICQNLLDEILCGAVPMEATSEGIVREEPDWTFSVDIKPIDRLQWEPGLAELCVTVVKTSEGSRAGKPFSLTRWVRYSSPEKEKMPGRDMNRRSAPPHGRSVLGGLRS